MALRDGDTVAKATGEGNGPIAAFFDILNARGINVHLYDYSQHTLSASESAQAAAYVEVDVDGVRLWGVGIDGDTTTASFKAVVSAVNRAVRASAGHATEKAELVGA